MSTLDSSFSSSGFTGDPPDDTTFRHAQGPGTSGTGSSMLPGAGQGGGRPTAATTDATLSIDIEHGSTEPE